MTLYKTVNYTRCCFLPKGFSGKILANMWCKMLKNYGI